MDIFFVLIIFIFFALLFTKALKKFIIFALTLLLTGTLYLNFHLPFLVSVISSLIILKGCKDTLFNLKVTTMCLFKSKYKFKENFLGKLVSILFELNFTIFILICYIFLTSNISYLLDMDFQIIAISFISIYLVQFIKKSTFKKSYYSNRFLI